MTSLGKVGIAAAFVYASCAALRLARFNVQSAINSGKFFIGLPSPAAAALTAGFVWSAQSLQPSFLLSSFSAFLITLAGLLMVSNFKYPSFKQIDLRGRVPFVVILSIVMSFVVITIDPPRILFILALGFALYSPAKFVWSKFYP
jgi:CDP-diacylglycerol--serine O-phosphatidyltransferase